MLVVARGLTSRKLCDYAAELLLTGELTGQLGPQDRARGSGQPRLPADAPLRGLRELQPALHRE